LPRLPWPTATGRNALFVLQLAALAGLIAPLWLYASSSAFYAAAEMALIFGAAIYLLSIASRWTSCVFASPLLRKIGQASFSIYLMHQIVLHFGARAFGLAPGSYDPGWLALGAAAVALPMLISHYVEVPLSRLTRRFLERVSGLTVRRRQPAIEALASNLKT